MYCEEINKILEEAETNVMLKAKERGLSPKDMKVIFKLLNASNPLEELLIAIEYFDYREFKKGKPSLCPGTTCLDKEAQYTQIWNSDGDSMFLLEKKVEIDVRGFLTKFGILIGKTQKFSLNHYFVGSEDAIKRLEIDYEPLTCPETGEPCHNTFKIYKIDDVRDAVLKRINKENALEEYRSIISEEMKHIESRIKESCEKCKHKYS